MVVARKPLGVVRVTAIFLFVGTLLLVIAVPSSLYTDLRVDISVDHSQMTGLSRALESYHIDNSAYPPSIAYAGSVAVEHALTTPTAYIASYPLQQSLTWPIRRAVNSGVGRVADVAYLSGLVCWLLVVVRCVPWAEGLRRKTIFTGLVLWAYCAPLFLISGRLGLGIAFFGFACLPVVIWFWMVAWRWLARRERPAWSVALLMLILPYLLQVSLVALVIGSAVYRHQRERMPETRLYYQYATDGQTCWILQSTGPNGVYDLDLAAVIAEGTPAFIALAQPAALVGYVYDPSNGLDSRGDLFRVGP